MVEDFRYNHGDVRGYGIEAITRPCQCLKIGSFPIIPSGGIVKVLSEGGKKPWNTRETCRFCGSKLLVEHEDIYKQYWADYSGNFGYKHLFTCGHCGKENTLYGFYFVDWTIPDREDWLKKQKGVQAMNDDKPDQAVTTE